MLLKIYHRIMDMLCDLETSSPVGLLGPQVIVFEFIEILQLHYIHSKRKETYYEQ